MKRAKFHRVPWFRFDQRRTRDAGGNAEFLLHSIVSLTMSAGSSHREHVEQIARSASRPFQVMSISKLLDEKRSLRGTVYFGDAGRQIDLILHNYPGMRWWMEKDGLVIDIIPHSANRLSEFDRKAGKLVLDGTQNGRISEAVVREIADELDAAKFSLLENLQPAQRKTIAAFNQKYAKLAVKSFTAAASNSKFSRAVRLRLYAARDRYRAAHKLPPPESW